MKKPKPKLERRFINYGTEEEMEIWGYEISLPKTSITWFLILATLGLLRLVLYWQPSWLLICTNKKCPLHLATKVLLKVKATFLQRIKLTLRKTLFQTKTRTNTINIILKKSMLLKKINKRKAASK